MGGSLLHHYDSTLTLPVPLAPRPPVKTGLLEGTANLITKGE
jgi:hypothetical protein